MPLRKFPGLPADGFLRLRPGTQFLQKGRQVVVTFPELEDAKDYMLWVNWVIGRPPVPKEPESIVAAVLYEFFCKQRKNLTTLLAKVDRMLLPSGAVGQRTNRP